MADAGAGHLLDASALLAVMLGERATIGFEPLSGAPRFTQ